MKNLLYLAIATFLFVSCGNSSSNESVEEPQVEEKTESKTQTKMKDDDRVSGSFEVSVDGKTYKSSQLQDNYCDMNYYYKGEKSFVVARLKDVNTNDVLLVTIYGDESFVDNPDKTIENFMFSQETNKANLQFMAGNQQGSMNSTTMVNGSFSLSKFEEGHIVGSFEGKGGSAINAVTKKNLIPFSGEIDLKTQHVKKMGEKAQE